MPPAELYSHYNLFRAKSQSPLLPTQGPVKVVGLECNKVLAHKVTVTFRSDRHLQPPGNLDFDRTLLPTQAQSSIEPYLSQAAIETRITTRMKKTITPATIINTFRSRALCSARARRTASCRARSFSQKTAMRR